jgi:uncharacterized protein
MNKLKGIFSQYSVFSKILILIGLSYVFTFVGVIVWGLITKGNVSDIHSVKLMQLVQSVGMFVAPPLVYAWFCSSNAGSFLLMERKVNWLHVLYVVLFMVLLIPAVNLLTFINQQLVLPKALAGVEAWMKASEEKMAVLTEQMVKVRSVLGLVFNIFLIALIPAIGEELFFRGAVLRTLQQKTNFRVAIWATAFVFSAIHMQFYGFFPRFLLGAFFGYLLIWSESLWLPIAAHFTNNAVAVLLYYLRYNGYKVPDIDLVGTGNTLWLGLLSLVLCSLAAVWLRKQIMVNKDVVSPQ